jgi:hypothetical protein
LPFPRRFEDELRLEFGKSNCERTANGREFGEAPEGWSEAKEAVDEDNETSETNEI